MNTRQKLTLGIAAIFMVTLTVIGVTYAYFVTRVNYTDGTATAVINTAEIGVYWEDDGQTVVLENVLPGAVAYKSFTVNNKSLVPVPYSIIMTTKLNATSCSDGISTSQTECTSLGGTWTAGTTTRLPQYVHTDLDSTNGTCSDATSTTETACIEAGKTWTPDNTIASTCYVSSASEDNDITLPTTCYNGDSYDNILVEIYRIDGTAMDAETFLAINWNDEASANYKDFETYDVGTKVTVTTDINGNAISYEAPFNNSLTASGNEVYLNSKDGTIQENLAAAPSESSVVSNLYVAKVTYVNVNKNQNIENNASVSIKFDITANGKITAGS